jgi:hypothetical protein
MARPDACPHCGASEVQSLGLGRWALAVVFGFAAKFAQDREWPLWLQLVFGVATVLCLIGFLLLPRWRCRACGARWGPGRRSGDAG